MARSIYSITDKKTMNKDIKNVASLAVLSLLFFVPFIGHVHLFDWDEINFAESAREMLLTGDYLRVQIFFEPFWEKPPLFIWLQAYSMHLFGINEFAARFPNAIAGFFTLISLYLIGKQLINARFGMIWALVYGSALLPFFYFKSGIIDPWFNLFIFLGIYFYIKAQIIQTSKEKYLPIILSALFIGLAVLTKGPVAILIFGLVAIILLFKEKFKLHLRSSQVIVFVLMLTFVGGFWFLLQIFTGNWQTVVDFFVYQVRLFKTEDAGHGGFLLYHFVILFFGVFPASAFAIYAHKKRDGFNASTAYFRTGMLILLWVVLVLFTIVKTKIVHYSSLAYFPISFLAAYALYYLITSAKRLPIWIFLIQIITGLLISLAVMLLPLFDRYKQWFIDTGKITHSFTVGNLQANPGWMGWEWTIGLMLLAGILFALLWMRKGRVQKGLYLMAASCVFFMFFALLFVVPKIEKYSQNAAIEFMKSKSVEDVYVGTLYKSYAMLFYTNAKPVENKDIYRIGWLLRGPIDKDAYFIVRKDKLEENLKAYPELSIVEEKNGYVFLLRRAKVNENQ